MKFLQDISLRQKAFLVAGLQLALLLSMGGKMLIDRATRPRIWVQTVGYDPYSLLQGRYVAMQIVVNSDRPILKIPTSIKPENRLQYQYLHDEFYSHLEVRNGELFAVQEEGQKG